MDSHHTAKCGGEGKWVGEPMDHSTEVHGGMEGWISLQPTSPQDPPTRGDGEGERTRERGGQLSISSALVDHPTPEPPAPAITGLLVSPPPLPDRDARGWERGGRVGGTLGVSLASLTFLDKDDNNKGHAHAVQAFS